MTRVDFHSNLTDRLLYACRLARKVVGSGMTLMVQGDAATLSRFDAQLWSFSPLDFLPHCGVESPLAVQTPIVLASDLANAPHHQILLNLSPTVPEYFARYERVIEVIGLGADEILAGRERYRFYKERGYALQHFDQTGKS